MYVHDSCVARVTVVVWIARDGNGSQWMMSRYRRIVWAMWSLLNSTRGCRQLLRRPKGTAKGLNRKGTLLCHSARNPAHHRRFPHQLSQYLNAL